MDVWAHHFACCAWLSGGVTFLDLQVMSLTKKLEDKERELQQHAAKLSLDEIKKEKACRRGSIAPRPPFVVAALPSHTW